MPIPGRLFFTADPDLADSILLNRTGRVIILSDPEARNLLRMAGSPDIICGSILLPPYTIMSHAVDETVPPEYVAQEYLAYMHSREPRAFICGILAMMLKRMDVAILFTLHEMEFNVIMSVLDEMFEVRYGIRAQTVTTPFGFPTDDMYLDTIYGDLFLFGYMDADTLMRKHSEKPFDEEVIMKLIYIYNPATRTGSLQEYGDIFNAMKRQAKLQGQVPNMPFVAANLDGRKIQ